MEFMEFVVIAAQAKAKTRSENVERKIFGKNIKNLDKKAVSGKVLTIIITLIVAIAALIVLWAFLTKASPAISQEVGSMITGFKRMLCGKIWGLSTLCQVWLGVQS
jgi:hypothetical protein